MKTGVPCRFSAVSSPLIRLALARISVISVDADVFKAEQVPPESRLGLIRNFLSISFCFRRQVLYHISFSFLFLSAFLFFFCFSLFPCSYCDFDAHGDIAKMPVLNLSELNIVLSVLGPYLGTHPSLGACRLSLRPLLTCLYLGAFTVLYGIISVKIKQAWYLGEARQYSPIPTASITPSNFLKSRPSSLESSSGL